MRYTVIWSPQAQDELAAVWIASADRTAVAEASYQVEAFIEAAPLLHGESRSSGVERVILHAGLGVEYEVIEDDKRVVVQAVWAVG